MLNKELTYCILRDLSKADPKETLEINQRLLKEAEAQVIIRKLNHFNEAFPSIF